MKDDIDLLELFSGIGGFTKGVTEAGFKINNHYYSEVDKHAIANYKYNFPNAKYVGSVTDVRNIIRTIKANRGERLVITFGSPCQDFSLAGKGKGLTGTKSSLIKYAIFLIKWLRPDVFIWENVKGAYSTNDGADYWAIIQAFANLPGYRHEQQLLNTAWFLPQNRERIYHIGHLAGRSEPGVFPIGESVKLHNEKQCEEPSSIASTLNANDNKSWVGNFVIPANTNAGFEELTENDTVNFSVPNSKTRRGRVGKGKAQTLDTACNIGVLQLNKNSDKQPYQQDRFYDENGIMPALQAGAHGNAAELTKIKSGMNIRRLTEIECERLQGFPDDWTKYGLYEKQFWTNKKLGTFKIVEELHEIPKTQRYKMCGNAVTVAVVKSIGYKLKLT